MCLAQILNFSRVLQKGLINGRFHRMGPLQGVQPPGEIYLQGRHGEGIEKRAEHLRDALRIQSQAVHDQRLHAILLVDIFFCRGCRLPRRVPGIYDDEKGFSRFFHIRNGLPFGIDIVLPGDVGDGPIRGHHQADAAVFLHNLFGPQLRRLGHGNLVVKPGSCDHSGVSLFFCPYGPLHHVSHGVNEPHPEIRHAVGGDFHRLFRDEFGL